MSIERRIIQFIRALLSTLYLVLMILTIPLAFDIGGVKCGLAYSLTTFLVYFVLTTIRLTTRKSKYLRWVSILYYLQHFFIPSLLTFFLSYYSTPHDPIMNYINPVEIWRLILINSTPVFTILEGFCSLLLIQAIGQTINWLTVYKSDSWLIVSLVGSGSIITAALYFLYRIYVFPFTIDIISASLLGSLLTLTLGLGLFGIVSSKGSIIESSLMFAYIVRCIYEIFPILSEGATATLTSLLTHATNNLKNEIPKLPPQILNPISQLLPFLASNLPISIKTIWEFLIMAIQRLTLPLLLNLAYRIGVFYAATKIIPSLYNNVSYPTTPPPSRTPPQLTTSRSASHTSVSSIPSNDKSNNNTDHISSGDIGSNDSSDKNITPSSSSISSQSLLRKKSFRLKPPHHQPPSVIIKLIYAYSPCIIIAVYTHLMLSYNGELGTELKLWGFFDNASTSFKITVHPWQFWHWINMATTLLLYAAELMSNDSQSGAATLTSHWKVE
ncbi:ICE2-domain-containing protein [Scheffersomyces coipomensis]|uniref:ICE2-domain-containing protein n=1 Tax=Scheffersomyces coipomensis TaxID=1788519 RepID=UPI00315C9A19